MWDRCHISQNHSADRNHGTSWISDASASDNLSRHCSHLYCGSFWNKRRSAMRVPIKESKKQNRSVQCHCVCSIPRLIIWVPWVPGAVSLLHPLPWEAIKCRFNSVGPRWSQLWTCSLQGKFYHWICHLVSRSPKRFQFKTLWSSMISSNDDNVWQLSKRMELAGFNILKYDFLDHCSIEWRFVQFIF